MPNNEYLNKRQRATVESFLASHRGAKVQRIRDDTCNYRTAFILWEGAIPGKVLSYKTTLELTPSGKVRVEETQHTGTREAFSQVGQLALPLEQELILPPVPPKKVRYSLYPKKDKAPKTKTQKPEQLRLPISSLGAKLLEISQRNGCPVQSEQELLSGKVKHWSLEQRRVFNLPKPVIELLKEFDATEQEWENAINLLGVLGVSGCIRYVEQLPTIRQLQPESFAPVGVAVIARLRKQSSQQQGVSGL